MLNHHLIIVNIVVHLIAGIRTLDFSIIIPVGIGAIAVVLVFSKLMRIIMDVAYANVFHFIFGIVIASTAIIAPEVSLYQGLTTFDYVTVVIIFVLGIILGYWMGQLEENYK